MAPSDVQLLFGTAGQTFQPLVESVTKEVVGTVYSFMKLEDFEQLSPADMTKVYWTEILYRVHWAGASNLLRHKRWFESCLLSYGGHANYLSFCASLRGMTEAAGDTVYSLTAVPMTLAQNRSNIKSALFGQATGVVISTQLEDALIHFQFARKLAKDEKKVVAPNQEAEPPWKYIKSIDPGSEGVSELYSDLCQVVHPASESLLWLMEKSPKLTALSPGDDKRWITAICAKHSDAVEWVQMASVNTSLCLLKVLSFFPLTHLRTKLLESISMSSVPIWHRIENALKLPDGGDTA